MKVSGSAVLNAPVDQVWAAFNDPAVLARTLPGCQELREVGPDAYKMTITAGVASIKGTYEGDVSLTQQNPPGSFVLKAAGAGAPGTVSADVAVKLVDSPTGGTQLTYDADAVVGGVIGGVGQRMLTGVAKKMAGQFFQAVDADIAGVRAPAPPQPPRLPACRPRRRPVSRPSPVPPRPSTSPPRRSPPRRPARTSSWAPSSARRSPWPAWPSASSPGGADHARVHRRRRPGRPGPGPAQPGQRQGEHRAVRRLADPLRRGHRRRAGGPARVGDHRLHPRLLARGAVGPGHRAARRA